jgi:hypothetical protein
MWTSPLRSARTPVRACVCGNVFADVCLCVTTTSCPFAKGRLLQFPTDNHVAWRCHMLFRADNNDAPQSASSNWQTSAHVLHRLSSPHLCVI